MSWLLLPLLKPLPTNRNGMFSLVLEAKTTVGIFSLFLFHALEEKHINAFKDEKLRKGAEITPSLLQTIQKSYMSIVIFSKHYADSPWCLDELVQINECREKFGQIVVPVFYRVDPADVQELKGYFAKALYKLKKEHKHKIRRWRCALEKISNDLSGLVSTENKDEQKLVQQIVNDIWEKLQHIPSSSSYENKLVGIESRVDKVKKMLELKVKDWRTIGIWGMPGIGKSALACEVFHQIKNEFDVYYFAPNVRKEETIILRDRIIGQLLRNKNLERGTPLLSDNIKRTLRQIKVLIVLDDVVSLNQLYRLAGDCRLYREGSRIIITSTDRQVLENVCKDEEVYEVEKLSDYNEALPLFSSCAFHQDQPKDVFDMLSKEAIWYAQGNPLAVRVLGSNFYGMEKEEWGRELDKLKSIPNMEIQQVLKASYDGLDRDAQSIFLDIACLFNNGRWGTTKAERVLEGCGFHAKRGIRHLLHKSLITILDRGVWGVNVEIHDLLRQMGKDIVNEESKQSGERSRLWSFEDILHVFRTNTGTQSIEGISVNLGHIVYNIELSSTAFMKMPNLRFLQFYNSWCIRLPSRLDYLPEQLRYFQWDFFPLKYLSLNFWANNLVELHLCKSYYLQELSGGEEPLKNLKVMNLSESRVLIRISNSFQAPNLEELNLQSCTSLVEIPSSLEHMSKLKKLNLKGCRNIQECPEFPCNLRELDLGFTFIIKKLPSSIGHCSELVELNLEGCRELENLPDFIDQLGRLPRLILHGCSKLSCLPESICKLGYLEEIDVRDCWKLEELPSNFGELKSLRKLDASGSGIKALPSSINQLSQLSELICRGCQGLTTLPPLTGLTSLEILDLSGCGILEIPESIGSLVSLLEIYLDGNDFESIPASINQLSELNWFSVGDCKRLRNLPELPYAGSLLLLCASNCIILEYASCSFLSQEPETDGVSVDFQNCTNLNKQACIMIMEDVLSAYPYVNQNELELCIPGRELPEKIRYRAIGSHISFVVEEMNHHNIIGYFFCVVIGSPASGIFCSASFKDTFGKIHHFGSGTSESLCEFKLNAEHVIIWYKPFCRKESFTEASFEFSDENDVIQCGIHPVRAKP